MFFFLFFFQKLLVFISPSVQDVLCCALAVCLVAVLRFEQSQSTLAMAADDSAEVRSVLLLCCPAVAPSFLPPSLPPRQIKSLVVLGNARSNEAGWSEAQKGPNMVFKRSEMEASALMERIIVAGGPPSWLTPLSGAWAQPGRLPGATEVTYLG